MDKPSLPFLPGNSFRDPLKSGFHKHQVFGHRDGHMTESTRFIQEQVEAGMVETLRSTGTPPEAYRTTTGRAPVPENKSIPRIPPRWIKYDRHVLRFFAYFQEPVHEYPSETFRIRKCVMMHHLDDETTYVTEPKVENSGIPQGVFLKKHRVPKPDGSGVYTWMDFSIGKNVDFYTRVFRIVDCDDFTRRFYLDEGIELDPPEQYPTDTFDKTRVMVNLKQDPPNAGQIKEYNEVALGGGHPNRNLASFIANDRVVLSFEVMWEDTTPDGGMRFYTLNYFLSDKTMEIKEVKQVNTGFDPYPMLLKRRKMPKEPIITHCPGLALRDEDYYMPIDLQIGSHINIYSRDMVIFDCDEQTKRWYREILGIEMIPISLKRPKPFIPSNPVPPYNGYGTEEDSMGNVLKLIPAPPKPDMYKIFDNDMHVMRFEAKMISSSHEDEIRKFILSFYPADDTIKVYEVVERNAGIVGGKFIDRRRFRNPYSTGYYQDIDCVIGRTIVLNDYRFLLTSADEYTHNYMETKAEKFPESNFAAIMAKITSYDKKYASRQDFLVKLLSRIDTNLGKTVPFKVFLQALQG